MKLPHLHVLYRNTGTQTHTNAIPGVDMGIRCGGIDTPCTACSKDSRLRFHENCLSSLNANGYDPGYCTVLILNKIYRKPLIEKDRLVFHVILIQRMQQSMPRPISRSASSCSLTTLTVVLGLATERALIDPAFFGARKRQTHMFKFKNGFWPHRAHIFNGVLVTDVIRPLNGVIHVPAPIIVGVGARNRAGNTPLRRDRMRACRKYLRNNGCFVARLGKLQRRTHAGTSATYNHSIKRNSSHSQLQSLSQAGL